MSVSRTQKRHPKLQSENMITTRADIIAFADFLATHEPWVRLVTASMSALKQRDEEDEEKRVAAMPKWRQILHKAGFAK